MSGHVHPVTIGLLLLGLLLTAQTLAQKSSYSARVAVSGVAAAGDKYDSQNEFQMTFKVMADKINFGKTEGVDLFYIPVDQDCGVKGVNYIQEWYAAYIVVPSQCSIMELVTALQTDGADFIFIESDFEEDFKLNSRAIQVPTFSLKKSADRAFMDLISKAVTRKQEVGDKKTPATTSDPFTVPILRLFITFPHKMSRDKYAEVSLFYSPANIRSFDYANTLGQVYTRLKDYVNFEPYVVIYKLTTASNLKQNKNCYLRTPYCAADPDGEGEFTGADVVLESLRQKCIFKDSKENWFNYIKCYSKDYANRFDEKSSNSCQTFTGVNKDSMTRCIESSMLGESDNLILKSDYAKVRELHELNYPTLVINGNTYLGHLDPNIMGRAICETLNTRPEVCRDFDIRKVMESEQKTSFYYSLLAYFYVIVIGLLLMALACICLARYAARKEVNEEVKKSVANYFMMKEVETLQ